MKKRSKIRFNSNAYGFDTLALLHVIDFNENGNVLLLTSDNTLLPEIEMPKFNLEKGDLVIVEFKVKYENGNLMIKNIRIDDILETGKENRKPFSIG